MRFEVNGDYDVDVDTFWNKVFFNDAFIQVLYGESGMFDSFEIVEDVTDNEGRRKRSVKARPNVTLVSALQAHLGTDFYFLEHGVFDTQRKSWATEMKLPRFGDKVQIATNMYFQNTAPGKSERTVEFDIQVKFFGVGRIIERFIERTMRESYENARVMTNDWVRENLASQAVEP